MVWLDASDDGKLPGGAIGLNEMDVPGNIIQEASYHHVR